MKIKNTKELKLRANGHARSDHILQGTYGDASANGHVKYEGCAVACLSTPHRKRSLRAFIKEHTGTWGGYDRDVADMRKDLAKEFGINRYLVIAAEGYFEAQETHGAAIEFVKNFAHALPEGANITPGQVKAFLKQQFGWTPGFDSFAEITLGVAGRDSYSYYLEQGGSVIDSRTSEFLQWLRERPVSS
jgi:hypothetical protein